MKENFYDLKRESSLIRTVIDEQKSSDLPLIPEYFPVGSCKLASFLLAYHFNLTFKKFMVRGVSGKLKIDNSVSHFWLEIDEFIIDITADQFNDYFGRKALINKSGEFPKVIVEKRSSSDFYQLFTVVDKEVINFNSDEYGEDFMADMHYTYKYLLQKNT